MNLPDNISQQIEEAFHAIATELGAAAPAKAEANDFAKRWWMEEERRTFEVGCADFETPKATIYAIEAARQMCRGMFGDKAAVKLLKLALAEMGRVRPSSSAN